MVPCLFDELPHFHHYPDKALAVTAVLFGSLIKHQLISNITLEKAWKCILWALSKPVESKELDALLQTTAASLSSMVGVQQSQNSTQSVPQSTLDPLLSSQSGLQTNSQSVFQLVVRIISRSSSTTPFYFQLSQNSSTEERPDDASSAFARSDGQVKQGTSNSHLQASSAIETVVSSQYSSTETTSFSTAAPSHFQQLLTAK